MFRQGFVLLGWFSASAGLPLTCASAEPPKASTEAAPRYELSAGQAWHLNAPRHERFDASALLRRPNGELWTLDDRGPTPYQIRFRDGTNEADLVEVPGLFTAAQLKPFATKKLGRYDSEGLAEDDQGRIYLCEESSRWILRYDPKTQAVERLDIDWSPVQRYFHSLDHNASFEGVAFGGGRIYVANERQFGRIIVVDPATLRVVDDFSVRPSSSQAQDTHYSDLCWFDGSLFVLLRDNSCILQIEPKSHRVIGEFSYAKAERGSDFAYSSLYDVMEGLSVDRDFFWVVSDNNGEPRRSNPRDTRPSLVRFLRPDSISR